MKIAYALLFSALSLHAYGATNDMEAFAPPSGDTLLQPKEAVTLINVLISSGIPTDNSKPHKIEANVGSISCSAKAAAAPEAVSCVISQDGKDYPVKAPEVAGLYALFMSHNALRPQADGSVLSRARDVNCSQAVPADGNASCNLTFD